MRQLCSTHVSRAAAICRPFQFHGLRMTGRPACASRWFAMQARGTRLKGDGWGWGWCLVVMLMLMVMMVLALALALALVSKVLQ